MHVTSKEITPWTWQTFWWTPSPDLAVAPSSSDVVAARPRQLRGAPRNYAMSIAYATESPAQPNVGGSNVGESMLPTIPGLKRGSAPASSAVRFLVSIRIKLKEIRPPPRHRSARRVLVPALDLVEA